MIQPHLGPRLPYMAIFGWFVAIFGVGVRFKAFFEPKNVDYNFFLLKWNQLRFWRTALSFCFIGTHFGPLLHFFVPFRAIFLTRWSYFWGHCQVQKLFWSLPILTISFSFGSTGLYFFLIQPNLGPFLHFLGLSGLFLGLGSGSKLFLGPTYIDKQLLFWKYSSILLLWTFWGGDGWTLRFQWKPSRQLLTFDFYCWLWVCQYDLIKEYCL